jgi:hypothetical protein
MKMFLRTAVALAGATALLLAAPATSVAAPRTPDSSVNVLRVDLLPGGKAVELTVAVRCSTPADSTVHLSTTIWQEHYLEPDYREAQGQTQVTCDGARHVYVFTATLTEHFADSMLTAGGAGAESGVQYCVIEAPNETYCYGAGDLERERVRIRT